jgi:hypothetical protein
MERASLVVMALGSDRRSWGITDSVARVLGACQRPVLFIPAQLDAHMREHHDD